MYLHPLEDEGDVHTKDPEQEEHGVRQEEAEIPKERGKRAIGSDHKHRSAPDQACDTIGTRSKSRGVCRPVRRREIA